MCRAVATLTLFVMFGGSLASAADPAADTMKAREAYTTAADKAKSALLSAFEATEKEVLASTSLKAEEKLKIVDQLTEQKKAFADTGKVPTAPRIKTAATTYEKAAAKAEADYKAVLDRAAESYTKAGDLPQARIVVGEKQLLGKWQVAVGPTFRTVWHFTPDGVVTATSGDAAKGKWKIETVNDKSWVKITWDGLPDAWDTLNFPIDPKKSTGDTWSGKTFRVEAVKAK
jgi:hypothetical protein